MELLHRLEIVLAYSAEWASPILRNILESGSRSDSVIRISDCRIILVSADFANILFHCCKNLVLQIYTISFTMPTGFTKSGLR